MTQTPTSAVRPFDAQRLAVQAHRRLSAREQMQRHAGRELAPPAVPEPGWHLCAECLPMYGGPRVYQVYSPVFHELTRCRFGGDDWWLRVGEGGLQSGVVAWREVEPDEPLRRSVTRAEYTELTWRLRLLRHRPAATPRQYC